MHEGRPDPRPVITDGRPAIPPGLRMRVCTNPGDANRLAVHGTQIGNYVLPGTVGKGMRAMIPAYTFNNPSSGVLARVLSCRAYAAADFDSLNSGKRITDRHG